jgi:hypothetical protein
VVQIAEKLFIELRTETASIGLTRYIELRIDHSSLRNKLFIILRIEISMPPGKPPIKRFIEQLTLNITRQEERHGVEQKLRR